MNKVYFISVFSLLTIGFSCFSQSITTLFENDSIVIQAQLERCHKPSKGTDINYIYLSVENKTSTTLSVDYQIIKWYNEVCYGCDDNAEQNYHISIGAGQTVSGNCELSDKALRIFDSMNDGMSDKKLTHYQLDEVSLKVADNE